MDKTLNTLCNDMQAEYSHGYIISYQTNLFLDKMSERQKLVYSIAGVCLPIATIVLFFVMIYVASIGVDDFHREIACIESGRDWVKGVCE